MHPKRITVKPGTQPRLVRGGTFGLSRHKPAIGTIRYANRLKTIVRKK